MAFSIERYVAICHPFWLQGISDLKRPIIVILGCWILGLITALPAGLHAIVFFLNYPEGMKLFHSIFQNAEFDLLKIIISKHNSKHF